MKKPIVKIVATVFVLSAMMGSMAACGGSRQGEPPAPAVRAAPAEGDPLPTKETYENVKKELDFLK